LPQSGWLRRKRTTVSCVKRLRPVLRRGLDADQFPATMSTGKLVLGLFLGSYLPAARALHRTHNSPPGCFTLEQVLCQDLKAGGIRDLLNLIELAVAVRAVGAISLSSILHTCAPRVQMSASRTVAFRLLVT
jgi:hypothetical protein